MSPDRSIQLETGQMAFSMRILNIVHDDKFIDGLISEYDHLRINATFLVLQQGCAKPLKYIKNESRVKCVCVGTKEYEFFQKAGDYDVIWVHFLDASKMDFVNNIPMEQRGKKVVVWSAWGSDLYGILNLSHLGWRTFFRMLLDTSISSGARLIVRQLLGIFGVTRKFYDARVRRFMSLVDFGSAIVPGESRFLRRIMKRNANIIEFCYGDLSSSKIRYPIVDLNQKNIWLGNSATYTNNHFDAFARMKGLAGYQIIAPLSYGDAAKSIDKGGRVCFGERWKPIFDFMSLDRYLAKMATCSIFVFPHIRQQALGNVLLALKLGGCLFMDHRNPIMLQLRERNITVYDICCLNDKAMKKCLTDFKTRQIENVGRSYNLYDDSEIVSILESSFRKIEKLVAQRKSKDLKQPG